MRAALLSLLLAVQCWRSQAFVPISNFHTAHKPTSISDYSSFAPSHHNCRQKTQCQEHRRFFHGDDGVKRSRSTGSLVTQLTEKSTSISALVLLAPAAMATLAFNTYTGTATFFHAFVDEASGHTWSAVDGGAYLTDMITPALTGPVAGFISLLFGTLSSMTVGNLYNRQATMAMLLGDCLEDLRLLELHISKLPTEKYRKKGKRLIQAYGTLTVDILEHGNLPTRELKQRREAGRRLLEQNMDLLHKAAGDQSIAAELNGRALDEAYSTLNRLIRTRSSLITTFENSFPIWHYGNLCILAMALLFIFLVLTDKTALLFLGGFQLKMCWSMLIGTFSMLAVVIYDLNSPLSGAFQVVKPQKLVEFELEEYVEAVAERKEQNSTLNSNIWYK